MRPDPKHTWPIPVRENQYTPVSPRALAAQLIDALDITPEWPIAPRLGTPTSTDLDALESWVEQQFSRNRSELESLLQRQLADSADACGLH